MHKIIITEPDQISKENIAKLEKKGYVVIETKDPSKVKILCETGIDLVSGNDLFMSALAGANQGMYPRETMVKELFNRLIKKESK